MQLDQGEKGFSFSKEGPLDMRMDPTSELSAQEVVNSWSEAELGALFRDLGEEPRWQKAARAIVEARKKQMIKTTTQLADIVVNALKTLLKGKLHPATLVFQALRLVVNQELEAVTQGISKAITKLAPEGRMGVMSFHSLEDRIVKNIFRDAAFSPKKAPEGRPPALLRLLTKKPLMPQYTEVRANPRARSAKLRFVQKVSSL